MTDAPVPGSAPKVRALPAGDFKDDEELLEWLEAVRKTFEVIAEELDEMSGYVHAKIRRYLIRNHRMGKLRANVYARAMSLPISRAADSAETVAKYLKMAANRTEAMVEAVSDRRPKSVDDFGVKGVDR